MSEPNPTRIIAEGMREVATEGTREDEQLWGAFPNTMTLTDLAEHVVSKLTDAGYSIVQGDSDRLRVLRELHRKVHWDGSIWVCEHCRDLEWCFSDVAENQVSARVTWPCPTMVTIDYKPAAAEGEKP